MKKEITLYDRKISYSIRESSRAKRLRIAVYCDCDVIVTLPHDKTVSDVEIYLEKKAKWLTSKLDFFRKAKGLQVKNKPVGFADNKEEAYKLVVKIIKKFNKIYGFKYNKITIKNHKARWGSCSKKCNLNFNYKIVFLPRRLAEYIVVHELCHLGELSHSRRYWNLVRMGLSNYKMLTNELKSNF